MFKWDELDDLKKAAIQRGMDTNPASQEATYALIEATVYQNEQILRELKSIGWKLKEINDRGVL